MGRVREPETSRELTVGSDGCIVELPSRHDSEIQVVFDYDGLEVVAESGSRVTVRDVEDGD